MHNECTTALTTNGSKCPPTNNIINNKKKINKDIVEQSTTAYIKTIVEYLNERAGTKYKYQTATTQQHIKARIKEGFTVDDFKTVIDVMVTEWGNDAEMKKYLRPQTLFGTKFESYLNRNQQAKVKSGSSKYNDLPPELFG